MEIKETANQPKEQEVQQYLTFRIGGEEYAVSLLKVKEIIEYNTITKVPQTPEWIRGVINLRGSVVPVVDLAVKFRQAPSQIGKLTCIVIAEVQCDAEATVMGVMVDEVSQVIDLKPADIEAAPNFGTRVKLDYLLGMARSGNSFSLILDTDRVLSAGELLDLEAAVEPAAAPAVQSPEAADPMAVAASETVAEA